MNRLQRPSKGSDTRWRIVAVARRTMGADGYNTVPLRTIAAWVDIELGNLPYCFPATSQRRQPQRAPARVGARRRTRTHRRAGAVLPSANANAQRGETAGAARPRWHGRHTEAARQSADRRPTGLLAPSFYLSLFLSFSWGASRARPFSAQSSCAPPVTSHALPSPWSVSQSMPPDATCSNSPTSAQTRAIRP